MSSYYRKTRDYILSAYSFKSLIEISNKVYDSYHIGQLTDKEYEKLVKLMDYIVEKGIKCIKIGL
nr:MAG TPA: hypothetical protein [Caudoviricetes sp.]